jgi:hypothetical protein
MSKSSVAVELPSTETGDFTLAPVYATSPEGIAKTVTESAPGLDSNGNAVAQIASVRVVVKVRPIISREASNKTSAVQVTGGKQVSDTLL